MSHRVKMENVTTTDTKIPLVGNAEKIPSSVIEYSLNMNVSLSNANRYKIFQRAQTLLIVLLAITFAVLCFHLKREVRALEVQMNCANSNLMMLMLRYDKLNKNFNRVWYHRAEVQNRSRPLDRLNKLERKAWWYRHSSTSRHEPKNSDDSGDASRHTTAITVGNVLRRNASVIEADRIELDKKSTGENFASVPLGEERGKSAQSEEKERYERAIVAFERRNRDSSTVMPSSRDELTDDTIPRTESRAGRARRDEGRGKKRRKIKRRLKRSRRRLGPLVATFVGAVPEQHVTDSVYVGPWVKSTRDEETRYAFNKFHLVEDKTSIEVTVNGLYMISAQIYYFGDQSHYSYWILLSSEGTSHTQKVIKCATVSAISATEASCYTSVVLPLQRGDRVHIQQQERDRLINLREGHSYVQIMLLSGESPRRRAT